MRDCNCTICVFAKMNPDKRILRCWERAYTRIIEALRLVGEDMKRDPDWQERVLATVRNETERKS